MKKALEHNGVAVQIEDQEFPVHSSLAWHDVDDAVQVGWKLVDGVWQPPYSLAESITAKILAVKVDANRRIIAIMPEWQQRNLLARAAELSRKESKSTASAEEVAELDQLETVWAGIKLIRAASDAIEAEVAALATIEAVEQYDIANNILWP